MITVAVMHPPSVTRKPSSFCSILMAFPPQCLALPGMATIMIARLFFGVKLC